MRSLRHFLLASCLVLLTSTSARAATVLVVVSEMRGAYSEFAEALRSGIRREQAHEVLIVDSEQIAQRNPAEPQMVVAVGGKAMDAVLARDFRVPVLLSLIPRSSYERLPQTRRDDRRLTAVFIDQPATRYVDLVRAALPQTERIGLLSGRDSRDTTARLAQVARDRKLRAAVENVGGEEDLFPALQRLFTEGGVLLATPDTNVFNSQTIPNIILSTYRFRVPVMGFSPAYVRSGALVALYSTPHQLANQSAEIARSVLAGGGVPAVQHPRLYTIGVNAAAARALGFELDEDGVRERLDRLERSAP